MKNPKISIIISTYNSEKFIEGRIKDLIKQTIFSQTEIIIVNSGSKEGEELIIAPFLEKYDNIKYIKTAERETIYQAWNRGIRQANGKYITNANTDDRLKETALEKLSAFLDEHADVALVYADQYITSKPNAEFSKIKSNNRAFHWEQYSKERLLEASLAGPQPMWRASLHFKDDMWFDESLEVAGDYEFACQIGFKYKMHHLDEILGVYYISTGKENKEYQDSSRTFLENYAVKQKYAQLYFRALSQDEFFSKYKYFMRWAHAPVALFYFWKIFLKILKPASRLQTRWFVYWFACKFAEFTGDIEQAKSICSAYGTEKIPLLIKKQIETYNSLPEKNYFVSVLVPTYDRPEFLKNALESLAKQTYKNFEVIVINNGNCDVSGIIESFNTKLKCTYIISDVKGSVSHAKNVGFRAASGEYIAYLDDDDWYHPGHLQTLTDELKKGESLFVYSDAQVELQDLIDGNYVTTEKSVEYSREFNRRLLLIKDYIFTPCVMHHRRCFEIAGGFDEFLKTDEDMDLWIRMTKFYKFKHIKKITCSVRRTRSAVQLTKDWKLMYENARYVYEKNKNLAPYDLLVKLGQFYYLNLRKKRAAKQAEGSGSNYY